MAGFQWLQNEPTVYTFGTEVVQPAERWTAVTSPSGIAFSLVFHPIPPPQGGPSIWTNDAINQQGQEWADILEGQIAHPNVAGVYQTQDLDASQQLREFIHLVVRSDGGVFSRELQVPQADLLPPSTVDQQVDALASQLNTMEAASQGAG